VRSQIRSSINRYGRTISGPEWAAKCLRVLPLYLMSLGHLTTMFRVGQENLPTWPRCHQIVHNCLCRAGILIKLLVLAYVTFIMRVLKCY
jgi:hypothetical protein